MEATGSRRCALCGIEVQSESAYKEHLESAHRAIASPTADPVDASRPAVVTDTAPKPRFTRRQVLIVLAVLIGAVVGVIAIVLSGSPKQTRLQQACKDCSSADGIALVSLADKGNTIIVNTGSSSGSIGGVECVRRKLGTPESIKAEVASTNALQGRKTGTADGLSYSWSYHPDNGLNMVIKDDQ